MDEFDEILRFATWKIEEKYFHFPVATVDGTTEIYRERVYCYELYHQLRILWPAGCPFVLNGEVDKRGHPMPDLEEFNQSPDFLVHQPGNMGGNHLIMEVKSAAGSRNGIEKDLETLMAFRNLGDASYARAILLIYGAELRVVNTALEMLHAPGVEDFGIEVWHHARVGRAAARVR